LAALILTLAVNLPARAIPILQFARMNVSDQADYVTDLVVGAAHLLRANGHPDLAEKAVDLFKDASAHGGLHQLARTATRMQSENDRNATNPNNRAPELDVEDAMAETLHDNGIDVTAKYLRTINKGFNPQLPPRTHIGGP
jgi:hypothetical protein